MPSRKIWFGLVIGLIVTGLFISRDNLKTLPQKEEIPGVMTPTPVLGTRISADYLFGDESSPIEMSPYPARTTASLRVAISNGEEWTESYQVSDTWTVQLNKPTLKDELISELGAKTIEAVPGFSNVYVIHMPGSDQLLRANEIESILESHSSVQWFEQEILETFALRYDESPPPFSDPILNDQWHLKNVGDRSNIAGEDSNIYPAWNYGVSGAGVFIAIVDTGTEGSHPDLAPNYRGDLDADYLANPIGSSAAPKSSDETHGTSVAGVAAAAANESCGVGAAFNAELIGVRLIDEDSGVSSSRQASAVAHRSDLVDIYNNSWGPDTDNGARMAGPGDLSFSAIKNAVENGRGGLGAIYVWAAGNGRAIGSNVNYDGWAAHRYAIAVGAVGDQGKLSTYSEPGAAMLVCAQSSGNTSGIRTTDLRGAIGADPGDCRIEFGGTSSASPLVAGIVALMLEANPNLGWRDVQQILAKTAVKVATNDGNWVRNAAGYWVNHNFGFGRVDAAAAVRVAQGWMPIGEEVVVSSKVLTLNQTIPDNSSAGIQAVHEVSNNIRIQHVSVKIDIDAVANNTADWGDLLVKLTSPSGTESILAEPHIDAQKTYSDWTYWSVRHLDENSQGTWTLSIADRRSGDNHLIKSWELEIFGTAISEDDNHLPVAETDNYIVSETTAFLDVLANDSDPDGDPLEVISFYRSPYSEVTLLPSGLIKYTPGQVVGGNDRFGYTMHDGRGGIKTAEVEITIPRPFANDDSVATQKNRPINIPVLANDIDYNKGILRIKSFSQSLNGVVSSQELLNLTYTPTEDFIGVDRFTYVVTDDEDGETTGEVTVYVTANDDFALLFDGDNDQLIIEGSANDALNTPFSIEAWIRPTGWGEAEFGFARILDKDKIVFYLHGTGNPTYNENSLLILLDHSNGAQSIHNTTTNSIHLNQWQHVAATYDNISKVNLYINGIRQTLTSVRDNPAGPVAVGTQLMIVGESAAKLRAFEGAIDEFRIWNRALSASDIFANKDQSLTGEELGLRTYYPMDEGIGSQLNDKGSPSNNGAISGAKWIKGIIGDNAAPIPTIDEVESIVNQKIVIQVTANDSDQDGDEISIRKLINVSSGSASIMGGSIIYQPEEGFTGIVRIDYEIDDGYNGTSLSSLILVIGEGLYYTAWEAENFSGNLGAADQDTDFDDLSNFNEYAFGTDPLSGLIDPTLWKIEFNQESGTTQFTYTLLVGSIDVNYKLQISTDLVIWEIPQENLDYELLSLKTLIPNTETRVIEFRPFNGKRIFIRLEAVSLIGAQ
ncbi:MAG: S8 family serine peptidase [Verrucomicrobia bacterium]|nr:S8 family serine peptidase [Verrucomicrobiota bacterium]